MGFQVTLRVMGNLAFRRERVNRVDRRVPLVDHAPGMAVARRWGERMRILGLESSCDETAAAVLDADARVLANVISSQIPVHAKYGGVVPELASRNHLLAILPLISKVLQGSHTPLSEIDAIAVTVGPGLIGSLLIGLQTAKVLAMASDLPLVGVDHVEAHVRAIFLDDPIAFGPAPARPTGPYLALAVSGGHTSLYRVETEVKRGVLHDDCRLLAHTLDDAAGEAFDKVAKLLGLPYPGGVAIDHESENGDPTAFRFPLPLRSPKKHVFSFSGLKTAARLAIEGVGGPLSDGARADLAASFQEAVVGHLVHKTFQVADAHGLTEIVVSGGVAANRRLRSVFAETARRRGLKLFLTPTVYCTDNAAMIAGLGLRRLAQGDCYRGAASRRLDAYANRAFRSGVRRG